MNSCLRRLLRSRQIESASSQGILCFFATKASRTITDTNGTPIAIDITEAAEKVEIDVQAIDFVVV